MNHWCTSPIDDVPDASTLLLMFGLPAERGMVGSCEESRARLRECGEALATRSARSVSHASTTL